MTRMLVLEVNEMPLRVLDWWGNRNPQSPLVRLATKGTAVETVLDESLPRDLYPSQSWASVGMGVPWEQHGVFWYGDEKPAEFPFYWQAAATAGRSVGMVGVLHSSPVSVRCDHPGFRFVIPDCFAVDDDVHPSSLQPIQALNLRMSRQSARVASVRPSLADIKGTLSFARHGVRPSTWLAIANLAAQVGRKKWNRERLRVGQSLLLADVFERQVRDHDPDLSVLFTNHLAAAMHRYWAATFPADWGDQAPYGDNWSEANRDEIPFAMRSLDRIVGRLGAMAEATDRKLVIISSMGQKADLTLESDTALQAVVRDPARLLSVCGVDAAVEIRGTMVPQLSMAFADEAQAEEAERRLRDRLGSSIREAMTSGRTLTITYDFECRADEIRLGDVWADPTAAGLSIEAIKDHRSGRHCTRGLLVSSQREDWEGEIDALRVAPLLLEQLGLPPLAHHKSPVGAR